jgi:hypothetical protein
MKFTDYNSAMGSFPRKKELLHDFEKAASFIQKLIAALLLMRWRNKKDANIGF